MSGMHRHTGRQLAGNAHLAQSIRDILTTPLGTRVMRRNYGSALPDIIDQPINGQTAIDLYMATAEALEIWEPRIELAEVQIADARAGFVALDLVDANGTVLPIQVGGASQ